MPKGIGYKGVGKKGKGKGLVKRNTTSGDRKAGNKSVRGRVTVVKKKK